MKILSVNHTSNIIQKDLPVNYSRFEMSEDTFTKSNSVKAVSFGHNPAELAKEVINNIKLEVKGKDAIKAFLALMGLAAGSYDVKLSELLGLIDQKDSENADGLNDLKQENERLREENAQLRSQLDSAQTETVIPDFFKPIPEEEVTDDTVYVIGANETTPAQEELPPEHAVEPIPSIEEPHTEEITDDTVYVPGAEKTETTEEDKEYEKTTFKPVMFPKKHGRLSKVQEELKAAVSEVLLPEEDGKKLTEICSILISGKDYVTKSGKSIPCEGLAKLLTENITKTEDCTQLVRKCYAKLELDEQTTDMPIEESDSAGDISDPNNDLVVRKHAGTSYLELKEHPLEPPKVLGKIDLSRMGRYGKPKIETTEAETDVPTDNIAQSGRRRRVFTPGTEGSLMQEIGTSVASSDEIANPTEGLITRLETTFEDPRISFVHFAIGKPVVDLFSAPDTFIYDSPFGKGKTLKFRKETAGEFAAILMELEGYYDNSKSNDSRRENVKIWANNVTSQLEDTSEAIESTSAKSVAIRLQTDKFAAVNVKATDVIQEISDKSNDDYTNIKSAIYGMTETSGDKVFVKPLFDVIDDIVDTINEDKRFKNFSFHGAMRLIERLVDFSSDVPIQDQCSHILDRLFTLMEQAMKMGVQVKTYMYTNRKTDKFDNLIVKIAPNVVVPAELYTAEDKKLFKNDDVVISLCAYQPGDEYVKSLKQPLIKTLVIDNKW